MIWFGAFSINCTLAERRTMEWIEVASDITVRQGDLLVSKFDKDRLPTELHLVITADCDISKGKFGSHIAALTIIPLEKYIEHIWAEKKLATKVRNSQKQTIEVIRKHHSTLISKKSNMTDDAAIGWLQTATISEIIDELRIPAQDQKKFSKILQKWLDTFAEFTGDPLRSPLIKLANINARIDGTEAFKELRKLVEQVQNEVLPEDIFIVSEIPGLSMAGAVILLRELIGIPYTAIKYRLSDVCTSSEYLRAGRLTPQIKYAVSQAFGNLYSKIGLSPEYEEKKKTTIAKVTTESWASQ